ncbi:MAG TPA: hypothetical protein VL200_05635 [Lacunisphaera sp.]|jgi:hypothetical protein|nr:hypothetical protein [Lacunisphaera sp.]
MKAFFRTILASLTLGLILPEVLAAGNSVASPTKRAEELQQAKEFLTLQPVKLPADLANPFNPPNFTGAGSHGTTTAATATDSGTRTSPEPAAAKPAGPKSDRDVLQEIAAGLKPGGFFTLGGNPILVFGQKRVKAGDHLTITFEGKEYTVEIISIKSPNFTLRLNREEFTRPIK